MSRSNTMGVPSVQRPFLVGIFSLISFCCLLVSGEESEMGLLHRKKKETDRKTVTITTIELEPFLQVVKTEDGQETFRGFIPDLTMDVCNQLGLNCQLKLAQDGKVGAVDENGTWDGMIGEIVRREADVAAGPITVTGSRQRVVSFSKPFMDGGLTILGRRPAVRGATPAWLRLLEPFADTVWLTIGASYVVVSLVFFLLSRFLPVAPDPGEETLHAARAGQTLPSLLDSFWWSYRSLLVQGGDYLRSPTSVAVRILTASWLTFALLSALMYIVALNGFYPGYAHMGEFGLLPVENAEELSSQTEATYGTVEGAASTAFFRSSNIPVYQKMWHFMSAADTFVPTVEEGIRRVRADHIPYYLITDSNIVNYHLQRAPCDLAQVGGMLSSSGFAFAFPTANSGFKERFDLTILSMRESEELDKLYRYWWYERGECPAVELGFKAGEQWSSCQAVVRVSQLDLYTFSGPLVALAVGLVLTLLAGVGEGCYRKKVTATSPMDDETALE